MDFCLTLAHAMIPFCIATIVLYGILQQIPVYDAFIDGARKGFQTILAIMPTLLGLLIAVGILRSCGLLDLLTTLLQPLSSCLHFPHKLLPLTLVKIFSSSAATGLLLDLYKEYGPDSFIGRIASISMSCTETILYTMSLYFMTAKIRHTRYTLAGALLSTLAGLVASVWLARFS